MNIQSMLLNYYVTGGFMFLEKGMILILLAFLGWNIKLYVESPKDGEFLEEPPQN